jgi:hypothetical protein
MLTKDEQRKLKLDGLPYSRNLKKMEPLWLYGKIIKCQLQEWIV